MQAEAATSTGRGPLWLSWLEKSYEREASFFSHRRMSVRSVGYRHISASTLRLIASRDACLTLSGCDVGEEEKPASRNREGQT